MRSLRALFISLAPVSLVTITHLILGTPRPAVPAGDKLWRTGGVTTETILGRLDNTPAPLEIRKSAVRAARAWMVSPGLADPWVGSRLPSQINRLGMSWVRPKLSVTDVCGSFPIRAPPTR